MKCPCFSGKDYNKCCKAYHLGEKAPSPKALMRSRYSAYALKLTDYIILTTHSKSRHADLDRWKEEIYSFCEKTSFIGLEVEQAKGATVTFVARLKAGEADVSFREKSLFAKEEGRWVYVEGNIERQITLA